MSSRSYGKTHTHTHTCTRTHTHVHTRTRTHTASSSMQKNDKTSAPTFTRCHSGVTLDPSPAQNNRIPHERISPTAKCMKTLKSAHFTAIASPISAHYSETSVYLEIQPGTREKCFGAEAVQSSHLHFLDLNLVHNWFCVFACDTHKASVIHTGIQRLR